LTSISQQPITSIDRATLRSAGEPTESSGDKSESVLKRVAEKIINYDMTPVAQALARHLGIDLSVDGMQARNRRGIAMIVHGPPGSGKERIIHKSEYF
jgi:hydrocephalus-inducing protein